MRNRVLTAVALALACVALGLFVGPAPGAMPLGPSRQAEVQRSRPAPKRIAPKPPLPDVMPCGPAYGTECPP